jgi:glycerophosphoryl diester phosphodiesterase
MLLIRTFAAIMLLLLTGACKKQPVTDDRAGGGKIIILGHRGMGVTYSKPANSYESVADAIGIGADGCELDVQMTRDSVLVLFHDGTLNTNTGCSGKISELTWDEIKNCCYKFPNNRISIISANHLFSRLPNLRHYYFSFDCKPDYTMADYELYQARFVRALKRLCDEFNMHDNVMIEAVEPFLLEAKVQGLGNKLLLAADLNEQNVQTAYTNGFFGIVSDYRNVSADIGQVHEKGLFVILFAPGNFEQNRKVAAMKPDIIQTDDPVSILKYFGRFNYEYLSPYN